MAHYPHFRTYCRLCKNEIYFCSHSIMLIVVNINNKISDQEMMLVRPPRRPIGRPM